VTAILDHHDDDGKHKGASPRIIKPTGSCASLVADYFRSRFPPPSDAVLDVASLLVTAIVIDTSGLKKDGKAKPVDYSAYEFLYPLSRFGTISATSAESTAERKTTSEINDVLTTAKQAVTEMSGRDLLRRDYKEYEFGSIANGNFTRVGLSTVPMGLDDWIERGDPAAFWAEQTQWIAERNLTFSGVLATFRTKHKQKHKREMLLVFPSAPGEGVADAPSGLEKKMYDSIEANEELDVERRDLPGIEGRRARAWEQKNKNATRKTIAPAIKAIIEGK
jgi:exopolyphosphatase